MGNYTAYVEAFIRQFFGQKNKISLESIYSENPSFSRFRPWLERLHGEAPQATVLPYISDQTVTWYVLAFSDAQLKMFADYVYDFIGPTYSDVQPRRSAVRGEDSVDLLVEKVTSNRFIRFTGDNRAIWSRLETLRSLLEQQQGREKIAIPTLSRTLKGFYYAVITGDKLGAERQLVILSERHRLAAHNILFLRVYMLSTLGLWTELLSISQFRDLLQMRKPWAVTEALIRAIYYVEIEPLEQKGSWGEVRSQFEEVVLPLYGSLFGVRGPIHHLQTAKMFLFKAIVQDDKLSYNSLIETDRWDKLRTLAHDLGLSDSEDAGIMSSEVNLDTAQELFLRGHYQQAFRLGLTLPISLERARLLLAIAFELDTLEERRLALNSFLELDSEEQNILKNSRQGRLWVSHCMDEDDGVPVATSLPGDWLSWAETLETRTVSQNEKIAKQASEEWDVESFIVSPDSMLNFVEVLKLSFGTPVQPSVEVSLPHIFTFLQKSKDFPQRQHVPVLNELLYLLSMMTHGGHDELLLISDTMELLTRFGLTTEQYNQILDCIEFTWGNSSSFSNLEWLLDVLELLFVRPCQDPIRRQSLFTSTITTLYEYSRRITPIQVDMIRGLCLDYGQIGLGETFESPTDMSLPENVNPFSKLKGKVIGIYTLEEAVAQRVKSKLENMVPGVNVQFRCDQVATEPLRNLVKSSNVMVVAWKSAKHAASIFIEQELGNTPVIYPQGKGSSSIWRSIEEYAGNIADQ